MEEGLRTLLEANISNYAVDRFLQQGRGIPDRGEHMEQGT